MLLASMECWSTVMGKQKPVAPCSRVLSQTIQEEWTSGQFTWILRLNTASPSKQDTYLRDA